MEKKKDARKRIFLLLAALVRWHLNINMNESGGVHETMYEMDITQNSSKKRSLCTEKIVSILEISETPIKLGKWTKEKKEEVVRKE